MSASGAATVARLSTIAARIRQPGLRDQVKLSKPHQELRGLSADTVVEIVQVKLHERSGEANDFPFQVRLLNHRTPWFKVDELVLANPLELQPPPQRPASGECCGSSCPNCVWIIHRQEKREWDAMRRAAAEGASLPLPAAVMVS
jgi:hypothetical protein